MPRVSVGIRASAVILGPLLVLGGLALSSASLTGQNVPLRPGDPLPGITPREFDAFRMGLNAFTSVETVDDGLGPAFNGTSCGVCHSVPAIGGISPMAELRAGQRQPDGTFRALDADGNTLFHTFSLPNHACQPVLPVDMNVVARRVPIPLFGAGLIEAIPDDTLLALADPLDRNRDGSAGRASVVVDAATGERRVGRFGWKAQVATLLTFSGDAYRNEMGITNDIFPAEYAFGMSAEQLKQCDVAAEPEDKPDPVTRLRDIDHFAAFMKFLAPITRGPIDGAARDGERTFAAIGCGACHIPALMTGSNVNPLFDRKIVPLYSDLLLHNIGTGDGIKQADSTASPDEMKTPALWGLRFRRPLLHDGSAATIEDAIGRHAGEGALAKQGFDRLDAAGKSALLAFLQSL
jgi:CxxC motif-containing protein (DUF1111 family)